MDTRDLTLGQAGYPSRLAAIDKPPAALSLRGELREGTVIAIVGTREASRDAATFAFELAVACVSAGAVVVSGGAVGIDAAAHRGALAAGGATWAVAPCGRDHIYPAEHAPLFAEIPGAGGAVIWPFTPETRAWPYNFLQRNRILVALADVVVVVQAGIPSGALNAAKWARQLGRPLWAVQAAAPWIRGFGGCDREIALGATPLRSLNDFLGALQLRAAPHPPSSPSPDETARSPEEIAVLKAVSGAPTHIDELNRSTGLLVPSLMTALLTLSLEHVLVEGPDGYFRRKILA